MTVLESFKIIGKKKENSGIDMAGTFPCLTTSTHDFVTHFLAHITTGFLAV